MSMASAQFDMLFASSRRKRHDSDFQLDAEAIFASGGKEYVECKRPTVKLHFFSKDENTPVESVAVALLNRVRQANLFAWRSELAALKQRMDSQDAARRAEIDNLRQYVLRLMELAPALISQVSYFEADESIELVRAITKDVFGVPGRVSTEEDDDIPGAKCIRIDVVDHSEMNEILRRNDEWHRRLQELPAKARKMFHLAINAD